ncbi:MAG TPA: S8 family peptidase [Gammaproteobacteria bacterium]
MTRRRLQDLAAWMLTTLAASSHAASPSPSSGEMAYSSGAYRLNAPSAWQQGATGQGIVIAVIDTGINAAHPDLAGHVLKGYNSITGSTETSDGNGHGTHVAGILGAISNDFGIVGIAYDAKILPVKMFDAKGNGTVNSLSAGIRYTAGKARIINLSLGAAGPISETELRGAVNRGQLIVAAAGNAGLRNPEWPARYAPLSWARGRIIAVGAVDPNNRITAWSNRAGVTRNFFLVTPGTAVLSTYKNGYAYMGGTSMATPYVSGAAAVVWSRWPYLSANQVANTLFKTATDLGKPGVDAVYGRGLVNLQKALQPIGTLSVKTASLSTRSTSTRSTTNVSSLSSWAAGPAYASSLYESARAGEFSVAVVDELGRDFQTDLGGLLAQPVGLSVDALYGQLEQNMTVSEQILADGSRLAFAPSALVPTTTNGFDADAGADVDAAVVPGGFAFTKQLANGDAWGAGINNFADRFFGLGGAHFAESPSLDAAALANPLFAHVPQHSHLGYAYAFEHGMRVRIGMLTDGLNRLYDPAGATYETGSSNLWTTEFSEQTDSRYLSVSVAQLRESDGLLGSQQDDLFALNTPAVTTAASVQGAWRLMPGLAFAGRYTAGYTPALSAGVDTLVSDVSAVRTDSFALGLVRAEAWRSGDRLSFTLSQPLRATSGVMNFNLPVGNDAAGRMHYATHAVDLDTSGRELRTELNYVTPLGRDQELGAVLAHRDQPDHDANAADDHMVAVRWQLRF